MEIATFNCKNCGANIDLPDAPGTVACTYCGSKHRVSFRDGSVSAELVAKVRKLDEDVALLKYARMAPKKALGPGERLECIEEGKRKWHEYFSSVKAGESKESPEMTAVFKEAQARLLEGYGPQSGPLIEDAYGAQLLGVDPPAGYSCLFALLGAIVLLFVFGIISAYDGEMKQGVILLSMAFVGIIAGIPFVINMIRADKADIAKRKEALRRLGEAERDLRQRLGSAGQK